MFNQPTLQETDLWEVWIEYDEFDSGHFGTLYVIGEILVQHGAKGPFIRKGFSPDSGELILKIPSTPVEGRSKRKEVLFSEPVACLGQYHTISIYCDNELLATFSDIETLI